MLNALSITDANRIDKLNPYPPQAKLFSNPFFPKHLYQAKKKKKKWLIFTFHSYLSSNNLVVDSHIFTLLLDFDHFQLFNLFSWFDMGSTTGATWFSKPYHSNKTSFKSLWNYLFLNSFLVWEDFIIAIQFLW